MADDDMMQLIRLNVGGTLYTTTKKTLISREPASFFGQFFGQQPQQPQPQPPADIVVVPSETDQRATSEGDHENEQPQSHPSDQSAPDQPALLDGGGGGGGQNNEAADELDGEVKGHEEDRDNLLGTLWEADNAREQPTGIAVITETLPTGKSNDDDKHPTQFADVAFVLDDGTVFIDRDGQIFTHVLGYLRTGKLLLDERFQKMASLREEANFYQLGGLQKLLTEYSADRSRTLLTAGGTSLVPPNRRATLASASGLQAETGGYITLGYRGTFAFGRDGQADVKFRKLHRILVCGKVSLCREVFGETLNESRDPDREGHERYTSRLYLKHQCLEKACDTMAEKGFKLVATCCSGANGLTSAATHAIFSSAQSTSNTQQLSAMELINQRNSGDFEEQRWAHYTEYIFYRDVSTPLLYPPTPSQYYYHPSAPHQPRQPHPNPVKHASSSFLNLAS